MVLCTLLPLCLTVHSVDKQFGGPTLGNQVAPKNGTGMFASTASGQVMKARELEALRIMEEEAKEGKATAQRPRGPHLSRAWHSPTHCPHLLWLRHLARLLPTSSCLFGRK